MDLCSCVEMKGILDRDRPMELGLAYTVWDSENWIWEVGMGLRDFGA